MKALQKLAKWRQVFAGWQLGTRPIGDPECDAVRDHREVTILMRAELNALTRILVDRGVITESNFTAALEREAGYLEQDFQRRFPGIKATDYGIEYNLPEARETMKGWRP
jgi:hypothetical protein